jgi:hypothetical protein
MQKHVLYVQSFTLIRSTGVWISSPGTGGIPNLATKLIGIFYGIFRKTPFWSARLTQAYVQLLDLTDFNELRCILIILMTLILKTIFSLDCDVMYKNRNVQYRFFFAYGTALRGNNQEQIQKPNCQGEFRCLSQKKLKINAASLDCVSNNFLCEHR